MINSIEIVDKTKSPLNYLLELNLPEKIEFSKGVNILVGENGCGKTTIINLLRLYTLCMGGWQTCKSDNVRKLFDGLRDSKFKDGIKVKGDYTRTTFNLRHDEQMIGDDDKLKDFESFGQTYLSYNSSKGQRCIYALDKLFNIMFDKDTSLRFDFLCNTPFYRDEMDKPLQSYYLENHIGSSEAIYSVLMDEPDQNLDIDNIKMVYNVLSFQRKDTQIIASLHNPLLIYKLESLNKDYIKFIELTPNYLDKINKFVSL